MLFLKNLPFRKANDEVIRAPQVHPENVRHRNTNNSGDGSRSVSYTHLAAVAVSRDGKWIAAGTRRGAVLIFLPGEVLGRPWSHGDEPAAIEWRGASEDPIRALAFSPDSDTLFFCDSLNTLWRGDLNTKTLTEIARFDGDVSALAVSPEMCIRDSIFSATQDHRRVRPGNHYAPLLVPVQDCQQNV